MTQFILTERYLGLNLFRRANLSSKHETNICPPFETIVADYSVTISPDFDFAIAQTSTPTSPGRSVARDCRSKRGHKRVLTN